MNISVPTDGATLPLASVVEFSGSAGPTAVQVRLFAEDFLIAVAPVVDGHWGASRQFSSGGSRLITLKGVDANGAEVAEVSIHINLVSGHDSPSGTESHLAGVLDLIAVGERLRPNFKGLQFMSKLAGGQIYFESDLDLDTDGVTEPGLHYDSDHLTETSLDPSGRILNANVTPYFVLPGGFAGKHGIRMGDVGAVLFRNKIEFAIFADTGPKTKIGEGSIALHRSLGFERVKNNRILNVGIDGDVVTLVFPGSGNGRLQDIETVREIGAAAFRNLGGVLA